jgi:TonB family protein
VQTKKIEYVMLTGQSGNANLQALAAERRMQDLTSHTGGAVYTPLQISDLDNAFAQISADLAQQYILSYYPTDERNDGRFRTISVRVSTRPNMRVRARRGYYPRRANERVSYNTETPAVSNPNADGGKFISRDTSTQLDNALSLAPNIAQPEKPSEAPSRSRRIGPSETGDMPNAESSVKMATTEKPITEQPVARRDERTTRPVESTASPPPKPVADMKPTASNDRPPAASPASSTTGQAAPPVAPKPVTGGVLNSKAVYLPRPLYPPSAKNIRASGMVTVEVLLNEEGKVISARAVDGNPFLRQAAIVAARQARFTPTVLSGKPVQVTGVITYTFTLAP